MELMSGAGALLAGILSIHVVTGVVHRYPVKARYDRAAAAAAVAARDFVLLGNYSFPPSPTSAHLMKDAAAGRLA